MSWSRSRLGAGAALAWAAWIAGPGGAAAQEAGTRADRLLELLHDSASSHVFVAAHRGGREREREHRAPENSLANVDKAVRLGFDVFETDVRLSADGRLVVMHDATVDRTTDGSGRVEALSLADLRTLRLTYPDGTVSDEGVPTFEELVVRGRGRILFKADYRPPLATLPRAAEILDEHGMLGHVMIRLRWSEATADSLAGMIEAGMPWHPNLVLFQARNASEVEAAVARFHPWAVEVAAHAGPAELLRRVARRTGLSGVEAWLYARGPGAEARRAVGVARAAGVLVGTRSGGGPDGWRSLVDAGFRMLHTERPEAMTRWLRTRGQRP